MKYNRGYVKVNADGTVQGVRAVQGSAARLDAYDAENVARNLGFAPTPGVYSAKIGCAVRGGRFGAVAENLRKVDAAREAARLEKLAAVGGQPARTTRPGIAVAGTTGRYTYANLAETATLAAAARKSETRGLAAWLRSAI